MEEKLFLDLIKIIRSMKKTFIFIDKDIIYGTDVTYSTISIIYLPYNTNMTFAFSILELTALLRNTKQLLILSDGVINESQQYILNNRDLEKIFRQKIQHLFLIKNNKVLLHIEDLKEDECFKTALTMKSTDKMMMCNINNTFLMSTFNSIHPVTKSDKISLNIYDNGIKSFLSEFIIDKKKYCIYEYILYRYL